MFKALLIDKQDTQQTVAISDLTQDQLPEGDVEVDVLYSTLNYKDALAITSSAPVVRNFPMVPGIDFVGRVAHSEYNQFSAGDMVVLNGWGVGEKHWGGLAQKARVSGDWLIRLPNGMEPFTAMAIGTAGYTAMLCVMALQDHELTPQSGPIVVTGASGGVGTIALALLKANGFQTIAVTGKPDEADFFSALGADEIIDRTELGEPGRPLAKERWAGAVDTLGGHTLANVCAATNYGGVVAACGMAQSLDFPASVAPFILRGVTLAGVDSVMCPKPKREQAWARLAAQLDPALARSLVTEIGLGQVISHAQSQMAGQVKGRVVVDVNA